MGCRQCTLEDLDMINDDILCKISGQGLTPAFIFDADELKERVKAIKDILGTIPLCYSIKANPFLIEALSDTVGCFEVCSPGELAICEKLSVDPQKIIYSGVHKDADDIGEAIRYGAGIITAESLRHYRLICREAQKAGKTVSVILRLTSGNQFGMSEEDIDTILSDPNPGTIIKGIHYFAGTGRKKIKKQQDELVMLGEKLDRLRREHGADLPMLEYGPGLPYPCFIDDDRTDTLAPLKELIPSLERIREGHSISLSVEMGRFIASSCGYYATSICDIKSSGDTTWCIVDGGINHVNYLGQMMGMRVPPIRHYAEGRLINDTDGTISTICGSLCTTNDILVRTLPLKNPAIGDLLVFENIGAYSVTEAMGLFLSRTLPRIFIHSGGRLTLLRDSLETWNLNSPTAD